MPAHPGIELQALTATIVGRNGDEILRDVEAAIRPLHDPDSHVSVIRVQDVGPMIVLETGLVHKCGFRLQDGSADGNILSRSPPGNSGRVYSRRKGPALRVNMVKESLLEHVAGMCSRDRSQFLVPPEGLRSAASFSRGRGIRRSRLTSAHICLSKSARRFAPKFCRGAVSPGPTVGVPWFGPKRCQTPGRLCPATEALALSPK